MRRRWRGASVALVAVVVLGAGCSSSSNGSGGDASSTTSPGGTSAPASTTSGATTGGTTKGTAAPSSGDAATTAEAALIEASDLGSGWKQSGSAGASAKSLSATFLAIPECAALVPDAGTGVTSDGSAQAEFTTTGSSLSVQYQVDVYPTEEDATAIVSLFESPDFGTCLGAALSQESSGTTISGVTSSALTIPSASELGIDAAAGIEAGASIGDTSGAKGTIQVQVVVLQHGTALGVFTVTQAAAGGTPPPIEVNEGTVRAAAAKLAAT